jgi:hypothetical protein
MLHDWLRPLSVDEFTKTHLGQMPYGALGPRRARYRC